jgi:hypothetical protein
LTDQNFVGELYKSEFVVKLYRSVICWRALQIRNLLESFIDQKFVGELYRSEICCRA